MRIQAYNEFVLSAAPPQTRAPGEEYPARAAKESWGRMRIRGRVRLSMQVAEARQLCICKACESVGSDAAQRIRGLSNGLVVSMLSRGKRLMGVDGC